MGKIYQKKSFFLAASLSLKFDGISLKSTFAVELTLASKIAELGRLRQEEEMQWRKEEEEEKGERGEKKEKEEFNLGKSDDQRAGLPLPPALLLKHKITKDDDIFKAIYSF